jgi:hypothetical protein
MRANGYFKLHGADLTAFPEGIDVARGIRSTPGDKSPGEKAMTSHRTPKDVQVANELRGRMSLVTWAAAGEGLASQRELSTLREDSRFEAVRKCGRVCA